MSVLKLKNVCIGFERDLIHKLNLELGMGDRLIVYGPNGIGKSTLLHSLTDASLRKHGDVTWGVSPDEILFIQQQSNFHNQTPDDVETYLLNILLLRKSWSWKKASDTEAVRSVCKKLNLANGPLSRLSGGQRQKLRIAQSLLMKSKVLLMDEPFNAIDSGSSFEIIQWLNESLSQTVQILVLHDFDQIQKLQSPILWLQETGWEILSFENWFQKVDKKFHSWMHQMPSHGHFHPQAPAAELLK